MRENYAFNFIPEKVELRLDNWQLARKPINGVAWYNLLANPYYSRLFNFIEVDVPDRDSLIVDGKDNDEHNCEQSDMVQVLLNVAFVPAEVVRSFTFGPGLSKDFKVAVKNAPLINWSDYGYEFFDQMKYDSNSDEEEEKTKKPMPAKI